MYKVKDYSNPLYKTNFNEAITYDFFNEQDVFLGGFNGFNACIPTRRDHKMELLVEWYGNHFFSEENLNLNADIYKYVRMSIKNVSNLTNSKIYFITDSDSEWNEDKAVAFEMRPNDKLYYTYSVKMDDNPNWKGKIKQLKFCPLDYKLLEHISKRKFGDFGVTLSYNYIQYAAEDLNPDALTFTFKYDMEGFKAFGGEAKAFEYMLCCTAEENGFYLESPEGLRLSSKTNRYLRIRQKTNSKAEQGIVAYTTVNDKDFSTSKQLSYIITDSNEKFVEYTVDLSVVEDELWQIRLYPMGSEAGYCEIDYLIFDTVDTNDVILTLPEKLNCNKRGAYVEVNGFSGNASFLKYLHINMQNSTLSQNAYVQWITDKDKNYDERKKQRFAIDPMSSNMREYTVGLNQNQYWRDNIIGLRIVPADELPTNEAFVIFGSASISRDGDTMSQSKYIREGYIEFSSNTYLDGWFLDRSGGDVVGYINNRNVWSGFTNAENDRTKRTGKLTFFNEGKGKRTSAYRRLYMQSEGVIDWRFSLQLDNPSADGMYILLQDSTKPYEQQTALSFENKEGCLFANGIILFELEALKWYNVCAAVDLDEGICSIILDGKPLEQNIPLSFSQFDTVNIFVTGNEPLSASLSTTMYKVGYLFEDFAKGCIEEYSSGGIRLSNGSLTVSNDEAAEYRMSLTRKAEGIVDFETSFFIDDRNSDVAMELLASDTAVCGLYIRDGKLVTYNNNGELLVLWENYKSRVWYTLILTVNTVLGTADFRINGQVKAKDVPINQADITLDAVGITAKSKHLSVRTVRVKPHIYSTVPYIDKAPSRTGLVGMQAWFFHGGFWNRTHNQFYISDKTPYLGHYDDLNIDAVDWQVKFLSEHSVDFIAPFMYTNLDAPAYGGGTFTSTFLNYSEHLSDVKFCITLGEIFQTMTHDKMLNNLLPFMIENYFKHPSYVKVDNKPVVLSYSWGMMIRDMTAEGLRETLDEMREILKAEGFDGLIILPESRPNLDGTLQRDHTPFAISGADRIFSYCNVYTAEGSKAFIKNCEETGIKAVRNMGCGWDNRYWCPVGGHFIINHTPAGFEEAISWMAQPADTADPLDNMVILDNWSEFGEGHSIQPTNLYGFGYLNAIRKVFSDKDELHYDTVPEGALNGMHIDGGHHGFPEEEIISSTRWAMPPEYEKKHNIHIK